VAARKGAGDLVGGFSGSPVPTNVSTPMIYTPQVGLAAFGNEYTPEDWLEAMKLLTQEHGDDPEIKTFLAVMEKYDWDIRALTAKTHEPVSIEEFVTSDYFLGLHIVDNVDEGEKKKFRGGGLWRPVYDALKESLDGGYVENLLIGAIGTGKTSLAQVALAYAIYRLSCEVSPHMRFQILPKNDIYYVCLNVTDELAYKVTFKGFRGLIENSPYFTNIFPFDTFVQSSLRFPKKIIVEPFAAYAKKLMGMDILGGMVDELNFMQQVKQSKKARNKDNSEFKQAVEIYTALVRRLKSRFDVEDVTAPIVLSLISSKAYPGDFTEVRHTEALRENEEARAMGHREMTYIYDKAQWEAKPDPKFQRGTPFLVEIGEGRHPSRILQEGDIPRKDAEVISVPEFFRSDFEKDLPGSLADFAGKNAGATDAYIWDKTLIWEMGDRWNDLQIEAPFLDNNVRIDMGWPRVNPNYTVPHADRPRAVHIDLALSGDAVGIACGHVFKVSNGRVIDRATGKYTIEQFPHICYDQVLQIRPPRAGQIELAEIRSIVYFMRDVLGIPIRWVTYDGFQSADSRQILRRQGFKTDYLSVENNVAYGPFRTALLFHKRLYCQEHEVAFTELSEVVEDAKTGRIDHPAAGSKDCGDAMVGVHTMLMKTPSSWKAELHDEEDDGVVNYKDRMSEREKEILADYIKDENPVIAAPGSIADRLITQAKAGRKSVKRRSLRNPITFRKTKG
jgi:hypothetical protein